jgi:ABC-type histidine transport system ATPase subunit
VKDCKAVFLICDEFYENPYVSNINIDSKVIQIKNSVNNEVPHQLTKKFLSTEGLPPQLIGYSNVFV